MKKIRFGQMQLDIMQLLWKKDGATAREITEALSREKPVAHSTVQTLLRKLEAKGAVGHKAEGRTFTFHALVNEERATQGVIRDFLTRLFQGSAADLAAHLVEHEKLSPEELKKLRQLIHQKEKNS